MTISIWRYSHLTLAISTSLFILLASLTGIVLAFEPISNNLKPYLVKDASRLSLSNTIENLKAEYDNIIGIEIDENDFVLASVITKYGENETFYINPFNAKKIGDIIEKAPLFKFATNLHRSLFLKSTGRFIVGLVSFLLFLIAITGIILIAKRQSGFKRFFLKITKDNFNQKYHIVIGRYALIPMVLVTLSGVYLSMDKFSLLPDNKNKHVLNEEHAIASSKLNIEDFSLFKNITLKDVARIEFPFSSDAEDYFVVKLKDKELYINQYTGSVISEKKDNLVSIASSWSMVLHTGRGTILWSAVLLLTCFSILFFMYSGFSMTIMRKKSHVKIKNKFNKDIAEYIILIGSETGSTFKFAKVLYDALVTQGKLVFVTELNSYTSYKQAKHLVVFTATYGNGEAPVNAKRFEELVSNIYQQNTLQYSVVGFGSLAYKGFCKYAIVVDSLLQRHQKFIPNLFLHKIHNQSFNAFKNWAELWSESQGLNLKIESQEEPSNKKNEKVFKVISKSISNKSNTFLIELASVKKVKYTSGDLLSIYPKNDLVERLYSIAKINDNILLSVKKHELGICSNYLNNLKENDMVLADIKQNNAFHLPSSEKEVIMIANGTGIAPFLGMINEDKRNKTKNYLFWGGRTKKDYQMYSEYIDKAFYSKALSGVYLSFSKEESQKKYIQNALIEQDKLISRVLKNSGLIMICGSIAMRNGVIEILENISETKLNMPLNMNQIKTDCY